MKYKITSITNEVLNLIVEDDGGVVKTVPLKFGETTHSSSLTTSMRVYHRKQMVELFEVEELETVAAPLIAQELVSVTPGVKPTMTGADPNNDEILDHMHGTQEEIITSSFSSATPQENFLLKSGELTSVHGFGALTANSTIGPENIDTAISEARAQTEAYTVVKQINGEGEKVGAWTEEEDAYIKRYYPTKGGKFVSEKLNRSYKSVQKKVARLKLKRKKKKKK